MSSLLIKSLLSAGLAGAVGLGGYGIYSVASKAPVKTVAQVLEEDSEVALLRVDGNEDDSDWAKKVTDLDGNDVTLKLDGYDKNESGDKKAKVKEICKKLFAEDFNKGNKLDQAKKWCTKAASTKRD